VADLSAPDPVHARNIPARCRLRERQAARARGTDLKRSLLAAELPTLDERAQGLSDRRLEWAVRAGRPPAIIHRAACQVVKALALRTSKAARDHGAARSVARRNNSRLSFQSEIRSGRGRQAAGIKGE